MDCRPTPRRGWRWRAGALFVGAILMCHAAQADDLIFKDGFESTSGTCRAPVILNSGAVESGTTTGRANDFEVVQPDVSPCAGDLSSDYPGPDATYQLTVPASGPYTVTVTPTARWDVALIILADCAAGSSSCLIASDVAFEGDEETVTLVLVAGQTVFLIVDAWHASESGPFTIIAQAQ